MICANCGAVLNTGARFCGKCGTSIPSPEVDGSSKAKHESTFSDLESNDQPQPKRPAPQLVGESKEDTTSKKIEGAAREYADNKGLAIPQSITSEEIKGDDTTPLVTDTETLLVE